MKLQLQLVVVLSVLAFTGCQYNKGEEVDPSGPPVSFNSEIKPIIVQNCSVCHSESPTDPDQPNITLFNNMTGDFSGLHNYAVAPQSADYTILQARLRGAGVARMPYS